MKTKIACFYRRGSYLVLWAIVILLMAALLPESATAQSVIATVQTGNGPKGVAVNPQTNTIYVANYYAGSVSVIDAVTNSVTATISSTAAWDVALNVQTNRIYVARDYTWSYSIYDGTTNSLLNTVSASRWTNAIAANAQTDRVYVSNIFDNWIRVFDGITNAQLSIIPVSGWIYDLEVDEQNNLVYAANYSFGGLTVIDGSTNTVITDVPTGGGNSWGVALNPQTNKIYLSKLNTAGGGELVVIDQNTLTILKTLTIDGAAGVAVNEKTNRVYLTKHGQGSVAVLDGATDAILTTLTVGGQWPERVAVHPDLGRAYVTNGFTANSISVIQDLTPVIPTITSFSPTSGNVGTTVTINGSNFSTTPADNIVYFGAVRGTVISATPTSLDVTVPFGATYSPISVTDITSHLTAYSNTPFIVTFSSNQVIDETSFTPIPALTTGINPHIVSVVDFDGDGKSEIVVSNIGSASVSVFHNISTPGSLVFEPKTDVAVGNGPRQIAVGDFDGDGRQDLAVANYDAATVSLLRNISSVGSISFATKVDLVTGTNPHGVAVGDFDGDGRSDLAATVRSTHSISIFRNIGTSGNLAFAQHVDFAAGNTPFYVAVADIDGDFKPDLIPINYYGNTFCVLRNTSSPGSISFATKIDFPTALYPVGIAIGDIDGDNRPDIAIAKVGSNLMSVFRNTSLIGNVSFAANIDFETNYGPNQIGISDLDGDGKPDLAVTNVYSDQVAIYRNTATSGSVTTNSLAPRVNAPTGDFPMGIAIGDLDNDGKPDLVTGNFEGNTVSVLRNTVGPARALINLGPAELFIGVTNSDNNGRRIDIKLEIFKNGTEEADKLAEGVLAYQQVAGNAMNNSKKFTVDLSPVGNVGFADDDILYAKVSIRRVGGSGNFGVRFWYNSDSTTSKSHGWSRMRKVTEGGTAANYYYFLSGSLLGTEPNHSGIASVLTATTEYLSFGTWSIQGVLMKPSTDTEEIPSAYVLYQSYPNPFNPTTSIEFALPKSGFVTLKIYNTLGEEVATLISEKLPAGKHQRVWEAKGLASGVYLYRLETGGFVQARKLVLLQ